MNQDEVKRNLLAPEQWLRMLIMVGYLLVVWVLWIALLVIVGVQTLIVLVTGEINANLQGLGSQCGAYLRQIVDFLVYATDERPFPFSSFPGQAQAAPAAPQDSAPAPAPEAVSDEESDGPYQG